MNQDQDIKKINGEWFVYFDVEDECTECGTNINHSGFYNIQKALDKINSKPQVSPSEKSDNNDFKKVCPYCKRQMSQEEFDIHVCSKKVEAEKLGKPSQES